MVDFSKVSSSNVEQAVAEYDRVGQDEFLSLMVSVAAAGTSSSPRAEVRLEGRARRGAPLRDRNTGRQ